MISQPLQTLDWTTSFTYLFIYYFLSYCPKHPQLYKSDSRPFLSCGSRQKYHVCLSPERIYSTDSLAGTPAKAGRIRFSLYLFPSFFPPALRVVSQVIPGEKFLPPQWGPLRNEIREGRKMRDRGQGSVIELLFIVIWPLLSKLFVLTFNIGDGAKNKHVSGGIRQWSYLSDGAVKSVLTTFLPRSTPPIPPAPRLATRRIYCTSQRDRKHAAVPGPAVEAYNSDGLSNILQLQSR